MATITEFFGTATAFTITNANLATSATAGWQSNAIDNSSNLYLDYSIDFKITVESSGLSAGEIRAYLVKMLDDSTWPDVFDGTQSAETITDTEMRDAFLRLGTSTANDTGGSDVYYMSIPSVAAVFNGNLPHKFAVFITQSTGTTLETTGNQVTIKGSYLNVAQS